MEHAAHGVKNRLEETAVESIWPEELHRQSRRADERPQNPGDLAAEQQVRR